MSTAQRELEELRKAREIARQQALEEQRQEEERQAKLAKKNEFLSRAALFQQKKGPSDEEMKAQIQKESASRRFGKQLTRQLEAGPKQVLASAKVEEGGGEGVGGSGSMGEGWKPPPPPPVRLVMPNRPPPPPPPALLAPTWSAPPPPPPPRGPPAPSSTVDHPPEESSGNDQLLDELEQDAVAVEAVEDVVEAAAETVEPTTTQQTTASFTGWVYVYENETSPYYWNMHTNDTTFEPPSQWHGELYINGVVVPPKQSDSFAEAELESGQTILWQEAFTESGEVYYLNTQDGSTSWERPPGDVYIVANDGDVEENWQEYRSEQGPPYYVSLSTGAASATKPVGTTIISQSL
eukprot:gene37-40_t